MSSQITEDRSLVKQIIAGNPKAMETFFHRYADPLYAFIYHHLDGVPADVEDIWQETLIAAVHALPTYQGKSRLFSCSKPCLCYVHGILYEHALSPDRCF